MSEEKNVINAEVVKVKDETNDGLIKKFKKFVQDNKIAVTAGTIIGVVLGTACYYYTQTKGNDQLPLVPLDDAENIVKDTVDVTNE